MTTRSPARSRDPSLRILVCGWAGAGNVGDELLTRVVVNVLVEAGAVPIVASRSPERTSAMHPGAEAIPWGPRGWRHISAVDGVCVGPGGIIQDSSSLWSLPGHLILPWLVRRHGGVVAGVGLGAEPLRRLTSRWLVKRVLSGMTVVCRAPASAAALAAAGVQAEVAADLAFALDLSPLPRREELVVAVGPAVAPGRLVPASRRLLVDDPASVAAAIDAQSDRLGVPVCLLAFRGDRDRCAARELAARLEVAAEVADDDVDLQVDRVRGARALITSRYHPVVVAAVAGTPTLVVSAQAKLGSLVAQLASPLVAACSTWSEAGAHQLPEPGAGVVPGRVQRGAEVLRELVDAAAAARSAGP